MRKCSGRTLIAIVGVVASHHSDDVVFNLSFPPDV